MSENPKIYVIIPAYNEENSVAKVIGDLPGELLEEVIVVNNNSSDQTVKMAGQAGACVIDEPTPGYGRACLKGISYLQNKADSNDVVVFLDADYSDHPEQLPLLTDKVIKENYDLVIGSRELGKRENGSMTFPQIFGNKFATLLIRVIFGKKMTDLGPFRAIRYGKLMELEMTDKTYGWTVEMQVKAIKQGFSYVEVPVDYRRRIGFSKISGTVKGTILAGYKILTTIVKYA